MDILSLTALELGKMIKERELTAEEAARAALERAKAAELEIHSYVTLDEEGAMRQAAEVQKQIETGNLTGPLAGVPVAVKDNLSKDSLRLAAPEFCLILNRFTRRKR